MCVYLRELGWGDVPRGQGSQDSSGCPSPSHVPAEALWSPRGPPQQPLTLDLVEVACFLLGQQGGVGILPGIHLVHKEGAEPATFIVLGIEAAGQRSSGDKQREPWLFHLLKNPVPPSLRCPDEPPFLGMEP